MPLEIALCSARRFFAHTRSVRGPLFLSLVSAVVLALPQQSIEIYRSIAQSGSFADVGQRRRELAGLAVALGLVSGVVWLCARFSTRPVWRTLRPGTSLPALLNILIALLPLLGVAIGCYRAQTLPLAPSAREAVATTLRDIVLAGGGNPTPALICPPSALTGQIELIA